ncbi:TPA: restriction endonuclease subunit S [Enterococcus faecium]|uniref:restriction endonuclease subunit S n=1 Tax=Enterococcus faecium TaxID=1352 RepID=UPI000F4E2D8F|nr:restriction endonuclease subunit S [Enterococcus faecium]EGP4822075.1 restriction endonuclease subunit S [Enterococcus faecium]EME8156568.1 restriction endonuclease subunit S [Enterococcus faecium]EME8270214.1 restriction endonuclease subunit S [Enterococcus faecium]ROX45498.1 restriction endonuclease subunit S [Enterococcus faecium]
MSNDTQPEIRFPGFTEDWEERKLKDIFDIHTDFVSNGSFQALKDNVKLYKTENYAYMIRLQDASNNWSGPWLYTDKQGFDFLSKSMVYKDDILMSDRGTIGKFFLVPQLDKPMTLSSNAVLLRSTKNDNNFIYYMLNTSNISNQIIVRTTPGVQPMISKTEFKKINTRIPNIQEQQKIGSFFKQLDNTIALHQRKLDLLKETKKGFLQKMFPKNGAKVPEIRFPGFTEAWEQRKLGEIVQITMGQSPNSENYTENPEDYILVQGNADMKNNRVVPRVWTTQITKQAEKGDLILSVRAPVGDIGKTDYDVVLGRGVAAIKGNDFIFQQLGKMKESGYWNRFSTGSTFESINSNDIREALITIPTGEEQQKIGTFFKQLDDTIALHQRKLDLLKETKKGFLQKMFV